MFVNGIEFPLSAQNYLRRHKPDQDVQRMCERQVARALKQVEDLRSVLERYPIASAIDIGCGLGLVNIYLAREFGVNRVHLVDGDGTGARRSDYARDVQPWNDVRTAEEIIRANVRLAVDIITHPADPDLTVDVDAVLSFKSWGLHYPVDIYLGLATRSLRPGGLLVLDIHDDRAGCAEIGRAGFNLVRTMGEYGDPARSIIPFTRHVFVRT